MNNQWRRASNFEVGDSWATINLQLEISFFLEIGSNNSVMLAVGYVSGSFVIS